MSPLKSCTRGKQRRVGDATISQHTRHVLLNKLSRARKPTAYAEYAAPGALFKCVGNTLGGTRARSSAYLGDKTMETRRSSSFCVEPVIAYAASSAPSYLCTVHRSSSAEQRKSLGQKEKKKVHRHRTVSECLF